MKQLLTMLLIAVFISIPAYAQKDTVNVPDYYDVDEGTLNQAVQDAIDGGTLNNTVFKLKQYGLYVLSGTIEVPPGGILEIVGTKAGTIQEQAPPMIAWTVSSAPDKRYNFDIKGNVMMKDLWLLYADLAGAQVGSTLRVGDSSNTAGGIGGRAVFDNVIFDYSQITQNGSGAVEVYSTNFNGKFTNCYFRNCVDPHFRYYGRALSFRYDSNNLHSDSVYFENCTFANMGYVYMQEKNEYADNVHFNHCTFYNIVQFTLESGAWYKMSMTNSVFVNTQMFGAIPVNDGEGFGGTISITQFDSLGFDPTLFNSDFTDDYKRKILFANNSYFIDQWLVDWMSENPYSKDLHKNRRDDEIPVPHPMINGDTRAFFDSVDNDNNKVFPFMNMSSAYDNTDPGFIAPPLNMDSLKAFLYHKWAADADVNWSYNVEDDWQQIWPMKENLAYTNSTLLTAGMGDFPLGDLYHWFPNEYASWKAQENVEHNYITNWLETGDSITNGVTKVPGNLPGEYSLGQNYPNPFNPTTQIEYSIPERGFVTLKVYDILGKEVATLFNGEQPSGKYKVNFNGIGLSSGVYLYELKAGNFTITKKLVLMK